MPPALKALLAQLAGVAVAFALARAGVVSGLWPLVAVQAAAACISAALLRSARWWLPIHLAFLPAVVGAQRSAIDPRWFLGAFVTLALVYWSSFRSQVPLYLSNRHAVRAVSALLPAQPARLLDIGAGTGSLLRPLARSRPDCRFTGIEIAPAPWLAGRLLALGVPNLSFLRGDFFAHDWADYDLVYAFLSPVPMDKVWHKARREMRPDSLLVSNSFALPGCAPDEVVELDDRRRTRLYIYRIRSQRAPETAK
jgi:SAM-dependent methyltransferase